MNKQELIKKLETYREWIGSTRQTNPIDLGFTKSGIEEMLTECVKQLESTSEGYTLNGYQSDAMKTCMSSCFNIEYMLMNLVGEVGEAASKIAKHIRKCESSFNEEGLALNITEEQNELLKKECGDIMWQIAGLCCVLDYRLEDVCKGNILKLSDRQKRNVIDGEGDVR